MSRHQMRIVFMCLPASSKVDFFRKRLCTIRIIGLIFNSASIVR